VISVIATVLNEGDNIRRLMESLVAQTCQPDEVVIVDGGSRDQTVTVLREYENRLPLHILVEPGANISAGRNRAIAAAHGELIAATDAGVVLHQAWLEHLIRPLEDDPALEVVAGFFTVEPHTIFEAAMGATTFPLVDEINPDTFLPSSRSIAFRKSAWTTVGGYPEWLDYCEDLVFDLRLKQTAAPMAFAPDARVYYRPHGDLTSFYKTYQRYARGDGKADLWRKRHAARYATYLLAIPLIFLLGWRVNRVLWALFGIGGAIYLRQPYRRLRTVLADATAQNRVQVTLVSNLYAVALVPIIRVVGDIAKMIGYPVGVRWRMEQKPPNWKDI